MSHPSSDMTSSPTATFTQLKAILNRAVQKWLKRKYFKAFKENYLEK